MKIKKLKLKKQLLTSLALKKFQVYKTISFYKLELKFKQILHVISHYHLNKKKILFIGLPYSNNQLLYKYSRHVFTTKQLSNNYLNDKTKLKNISLIVFFNSKIEDLKILNDLRFTRKPLIVIGQFFFSKNTQIGDYFVNLNLKSKSLKQFCAFIIYSIIKKG